MPDQRHEAAGAATEDPDRTRTSAGPVVVPAAVIEGRLAPVFEVPPTGPDAA